MGEKKKKKKKLDLINNYLIRVKEIYLYYFLSLKIFFFQISKFLEFLFLVD